MNPRRGEINFTSFAVSEGKVAFLDDHARRIGVESTELQKLVSNVKARSFRARAFVADFLILESEGMVAREKTSVISMENPNWRSFKDPSKKQLNYEKLFEMRDNLGEIVFHEAQEILEATTSNIFFIKGQTLYTPEINLHVLDGITRKNVIAMARDKGFEVEVGFIDLNTIDQFEGAFLTNSVHDMVWITKFDHHEFTNFDGFKELKRYFHEYKKQSYEN